MFGKRWAAFLLLYWDISLDVCKSARCPEQNGFILFDIVLASEKTIFRVPGNVLVNVGPVECHFTGTLQLSDVFPERGPLDREQGCSLPFDGE